MRMPTRLNITWESDNTLRIDTDAGTQTRRLYFSNPPASGEPSWQGRSIAEWEAAGGGGRGAARQGSLKVVTTNLRPGYVRRGELRRRADIDDRGVFAREPAPVQFLHRNDPK